MLRFSNDHDTFSRVFRALLLWKIVYGVAKVIIGFALLKWVVIDPAGLFYKIMAQEIIEDPNDFLIRLVSPLIEHVSLSTTTFVALYLLFWGIVDDIFLSINILRYKLWSFPVALTLIAMFVPYELYRVWHTHSWILLGVITIDIVVFLVIVKEYKKVKLSQTKV